MKLYKITQPAAALDPMEVDTQQTIRFEGTQADARKTRIEFEEPFKCVKPAKRPRVEVEEVDVPTDKNGLLDWLNKNAA